MSYEQTMSDIREGCCGTWPKPCTYHEGFADGLECGLPELLPCPTCGGTKEALIRHEAAIYADRKLRIGPCPANGGNCDGYLSIADSLAIVRAVFEYELTMYETISPTTRMMLEDFRSVRAEVTE